MNQFKHYVRKLPLYIRARPFEEGDVVYDGAGQVIRYQPGDYLIDLETDRFKLDGELFHQLYEEVSINAN